MVGAEAGDEDTRAHGRHRREHVALAGRQQPKATYAGSREMILITLGPEGGFGMLGIVWGFVIRTVAGDVQVEDLGHRLHAQGTRVLGAEETLKPS